MSCSSPAAGLAVPSAAIGRHMRGWRGRKSERVGRAGHTDPLYYEELRDDLPNETHMTPPNTKSFIRDMYSFKHLQHHSL